MTEDLAKRVENAASGITPQTRPDERRRFLGSLRERVFVRMSIKEATDPALTKLFMDHFADYHGYTILINANTPNPAFVGQIESRASKEQTEFRLVNDETARTGDDDSAILVVSKEAINRMRVEINQVYAPPLPAEELPAAKKKTSFWKQLFGGKQ
ncbi:hypothetical protein lacNasYZ03_10340 [Lactobacillus nasalidis]|uniref:DUF1694 domain-containing protein n=1 Tax=Lactobacillus nasalidis TaxID=2797258 RepID=A0ABQ3W6Y2_9LACO|nr:YueI family protein [Lactobacillus nasalidis]GHV97983.1 hypothetical protein lacNasYZ01_11650 [Lactobacillus nasalidis]GHV99814.1 hypothetical protein lacNasYZ02_12440 [Lactobacillus nasalidis]GHW01347.1 hypothetical protein lacNasYZ03_10340 [Lactobacillus nasalidis]